MKASEPKAIYGKQRAQACDESNGDTTGVLAAFRTAPDGVFINVYEHNAMLPAAGSLAVSPCFQGVADHPPLTVHSGQFLASSFKSLITH
jgi:hypothetical protein